MGIIFNIVKDYTFLFKGGKFMDKFEKVEGEELKEVTGGMYCGLRLEEHKCIKCEKAFWTRLEDHDHNPYCYECRGKSEVYEIKPKVTKDKKVIPNPILSEIKN